jgi:nucleoside-diphosphate-sugar epimerase
MAEKHVNLVAGALGVAGRGLLEELGKLEGHRTIALSRRSPDFQTNAEFISIDLTSEDDCREKLGKLRDITNIYFAAYAPAETPQKEVQTNLAMLSNLVSAIDNASHHLKHVCIVHGSKWYGNHLGPYKTPARENDPRHMPPNFYYDQQDWIQDFQKGKAWTWTTYRPHGLCGVSVGSAMNQLMALAVYASISKELGLSLRFPGKPGAFSAVYQFTDARLLARAMIWGSERKLFTNRAFNLTNGDVDRWENIWPEIANSFGLEPGGVQNISLAAFMADKQPIWDRLVKRHGLRHYELSKLVNWQFADWVYSSEFDQISSLDAFRQTGWSENLRADIMFAQQFHQLRMEKIIP